MKRLAFAASLLGITPVFGGPPALPVSENFTTDGEGSSYFSNHAGSGADVFERATTNPPFGFGGALLGADGPMWAMEDVDAVASPFGVWTLKTITGAGSFAGREVTIKFAEYRNDGRIDPDDKILIQYAFEGDISESGTPGSGDYTTIGGLYADDSVVLPFNGAHLREDTNNDGSASIEEAGQIVDRTFRDFVFNVPNGGTDLSIRIICDIDGGSEEVAFDDIRVTGIIATTETPVLSAIEGGAATFNEGGAAVQITNALEISDADSADLTGATVSITSNFDGSEDVLQFTNQNGISGNYDSGTGVLTLSGTASLLNYRNALRSVDYFNSDTSDAVMATRTISFQVTDDQSNTSIAVSRGVDVNTALSPPTTLPLGGYCESFETDGEGTRYGSNHAVVNPSSDFFERFDTTSPPAGYFGPAIAGPALDGTFAWVSEDTQGTTGGTGMVTLAPLTVTGYSSLSVSMALEQARTGDIDQWENTDFVKVLISMDGSPFTAIGAFYGDDSNGGNGLLREDTDLNGVSSDLDGGLEVPDELTDYTFPILITGTTLVVRVEVNSNASEELAFDNICIDGVFGPANEPPVLANIEGGPISYAEGDPAVNITGTLTVSDNDDTDLESATVEIISGFDASEDQLLFSDQNGITGNIVGDTLTLSGTSSLANYEAALRSVQYNNTDLVDPSPATRVVEFIANDGTTNGNSVQRSIEVTPVLNDPVSITTSGVCESFETDGEGSRHASSHGISGNDYFERVTAATPPAGFQGGAISGPGLDGTFAWAAEDSVNLIGGEAVLLLAPYSITRFTDLNVSIALESPRLNDPVLLRWEPEDGLAIDVSIDGGPFTMIGNFRGDSGVPGTAGELRQDLDLDGDASDGDGGATVPLDMTNYDFPLATTGDTIQLRVRYLGSASEELAFDNICITGTDGAPPTAVLADPVEAGSIVADVLNTRGYIDVTFADNDAIDPGTITDAANEVVLSGVAAAGVNLNGTPTIQSGTTYRYSFTGDFVPGAVGVSYPAGSFADVSANPNDAGTGSFTVENSPPVAGTDDVDRFPTSSLKIPDAILLFNDSDPEDGMVGLSITGVNHAGGNGASVSLSGGTIFYDPGPHTGPDTFTYTLRDQQGLTSTGTVNVNLVDDDSPALNITDIDLPGDGTLVLTGAGIPGRVYTVQVADSNIPNAWTNYDTTQADPANGVITYVDPNPEPATRIYRFVHP